MRDYLGRYVKSQLLMICQKVQNTSLNNVFPVISVFILDVFLVGSSWIYIELSGTRWWTWKDVSKVPFSESIFEKGGLPENMTGFIFHQIVGVKGISTPKKTNVDFLSITHGFSLSVLWLNQPTDDCLGNLPRIVNHQPVNDHLTMDSRLLQHKQAIWQDLAGIRPNHHHHHHHHHHHIHHHHIHHQPNLAPRISFSFLVFLLLLKVMSLEFSSNAGDLVSTELSSFPVNRNRLLNCDDTKPRSAWRAQTTIRPQSISCTYTYGFNISYNHIHIPLSLHVICGFACLSFLSVHGNICHKIRY